MNTIQKEIIKQIEFFVVSTDILLKNSPCSLVLGHFTSEKLNFYLTKINTEYILVLDFPRRKSNEYYFDVNDMGEGVAGGKCQLTGEAKSVTFCAVEKSGFLAKSLTCKMLVKR